MSDWILTIPQQVEWTSYAREIAAVADGGQVMNYRIGTQHKNTGIRVGDRIWVVHRGQVRGFMRCTGLWRTDGGFTCTTTGAKWPAGLYVQRAGDFTYVDGPMMKGFQGVRRFPRGALLA